MGRRTATLLPARRARGIRGLRRTERGDCGPRPSAALTVRYARRLPFLKKPTSDRWHAGVTPDSGGIAIFVALAAGYLIAFHGAHLNVALAACAMWVLGTIDDRLRLRARTKFLLQVAIVAAAVFSGVRFSVVPTHAVAVAFTFVWLIGITNAFNLIDNMDGLAAGVGVIIALFRAATLFAGGYREDAVLSALIAAAILGFLAFNVHPAKIFMGDGGSLLIGFTLAAVTATGAAPETKSFLAGFFCPALTFAYPIFDTTLVSILRRGAGRPISVGGRDHSSHRLASLGMRERSVVSALWILTAAGSIAGLLLYRMPILARALASLAIVFAVLFAIFLATLPAYPLPAGPPMGRLRILRRWVPSLRAGITLALDVLLSAIALFGAFMLRFEFDVPASQFRNLLASLPFIVAINLAASVLAKSYEWSWQFFGLQDIGPVVRVTLATRTACAIVSILLKEYSRGVVVLFPILALGLAIIVRSSMRLFRFRFEASTGGGLRGAVIFRADAEGESLARFLLASSFLPVRPVGFVDDRPVRQGVRICGLPVHPLSGIIKLRGQIKAEMVLVTETADRESNWPELDELWKCAGLEICAANVAIQPYSRRPVALAHAAAGD